MHWNAVIQFVEKNGMEYETTIPINAYDKKAADKQAEGWKKTLTKRGLVVKNVTVLPA
jgi:hypothetical protein